MQDRLASLARARSETFDLVIIGGGISGAGVAQNAASRGLSVLVIDKSDFASGTSSKTTKLIHGGLRYLEQFHFSLCRQLCEERERLKRLAPHLVKDFSFVLPFGRAGHLFDLKATIGLGVYDLLTFSAGTTNPTRRLSRKRLEELAPSVNARGLTGGLEFHDAISDDSRMVLSVIKSACDMGAVCLNYVQATGISVEAGRIRQIRCRDRLSGEEFSVACRVCVNATGVWTDEVLDLVAGPHPRRIKPSKGVHLLVAPSAFETHTALFLPTRDGRFVFVVPWLRGLMIGTTDTGYAGDIESPRAELDDVDYLLGVVNGYSDSHELTRADVKGTFAGLRPLVDLGGDSAADNPHTASREHIIFESGGGMVNVAGGKLTSYRLMAEEVMELVAKQMPEAAARPSTTGSIMLGGWKGAHDYLAGTASISARGRKLGLDPATIDHIIANYGSDGEKVLDFVEKDPGLKARICPDFPPVMAEVVFCAAYEMAVSLEDMLFRRVRLGLLNFGQCMEAAGKVADIMQQLLGWDETRVLAELAHLEGARPVTDEPVMLQPANQSK